MLERYTAVDVETPNRNNDSICSIGIVHMEYGAPVYRREFLVNPREHFDDYNIKIHGITPGMVADAPLFPEIWPEIEPFFHGIMAAHSAAFDLGVICKSLAVYGLSIPEITYICSLQKSKKHIPKELYGRHKEVSVQGNTAHRIKAGAQYGHTCPVEHHGKIRKAQRAVCRVSRSAGGLDAQIRQVPPGSGRARLPQPDRRGAAKGRHNRGRIPDHNGAVIC
ncbi:MAG: hypothetical protein KHW61_08880 [Clostridium sp.]|nr:hypothetical protein [Clostridium sp.]